MLLVEMKSSSISPLKMKGDTKKPFHTEALPNCAHGTHVSNNICNERQVSFLTMYIQHDNLVKQQTHNDVNGINVNIETENM